MIISEHAPPVPPPATYSITMLTKKDLLRLQWACYFGSRYGLAKEIIDFCHKLARDLEAVTK